MGAQAKMRNALGWIFGLCLVCWVMATPASAQEEFRGFWADAFQVGYKSTSQIDDMVSRAVTGRYNAIVAEVLAYHDTGANGHGAYWNSGIVPKASDISGNLDPLAYLCQQAHAQGIEVHAWIVPFRVSTSWPPSGNTLLSANPEWLMVERANLGGGPSMVGNRYTLDPGSPDVQDYLISIVQELVTNYPIDGINWDYIRYIQTDGGYPADANYTKSSLARFQAITGRTDVPPADGDAAWDDFRRRTISELIRRCRAEVPSIRSNPRQPLRITADLLATGSAPTNFSSSLAYNLFQNWRHWMEMGWLDASMPMNYKREHCSNQAGWYRDWIDQALIWRYDRHAFCGQGNYLNSFADSVAQMQYAYSQGANGSMNFSYVGTRSTESLCDGNDAWVTDWTWYNHVGSNLFTSTVPTPTMPWRDPATATEGTIWGQVRDLATGQPVDDATVSIGSIFGGGKSVQTDGNGYYTVTLLAALAAGSSYSADVSKSGLPAASDPSVKILAGDVTRYDFLLGAPPAEIAAAPSVINVSTELGESPSDRAFTITNAAGGSSAPLNYFVTDDALWIQTNPVQGISYGEQDTLDVIFDTTALAEGAYAATISVSDASALNSPQTVTVNLLVGGDFIPGDYDLDRDVDLDDFATHQQCLTGAANGPPTPGCEATDLDSDNDVDTDDVTLLIGCMSSAGILGDPTCLD